jgi:Bacterial DNA polymerase III alpha subunit finger domain
MSRGLLTEMAVVGNAAMAGRTALEWDKDDVDALKLLKVDVLALGMLSCLRRGFDLRRKHHGLDYDLAFVPHDRAKTYAMPRRPDSLGVSQVESRAGHRRINRIRNELARFSCNVQRGYVPGRDRGGRGGRISLAPGGRYRRPRRLGQLRNQPQRRRDGADLASPRRPFEGMVARPARRCRVRLDSLACGCGYAAKRWTSSASSQFSPMAASH